MRLGKGSLHDRRVAEWAGEEKRRGGDGEGNGEGGNYQRKRGF
jgi:hypothetical protein